MKRILFLGTHGQKNWGDELLLDVFTSQLGAAVDKFYVNSYDPAETKAFLKDKNVETFNTASQRTKLMKYLLRCDALVFGGGSIIKELYTAYGGDRYSTLNILNTLTMVARFIGKPIYFCNIGVGPLSSTKGKELAAKILARGTSVTVRDSESFELLKKMNVDFAFRQASDAVFSIDRNYLQLPGKKAKSGRVKTIGLNLCRNIGNNENWPYFIDQLLADFATWLTQHPDTKIVGIPMQYDVDNNNDHAQLEMFRERLQKLVPDVQFEIVKPTSIPEFAKVIDGVDLMVAERLHALILSIVIGTPLVALEYDIKVTGIMSDVGLSRYGVNINRKFKPGSIRAAMVDVADHYKDATREVARAYTAHHTVARESFEKVCKSITS